ncbi:MAG: chloride channel protein [Verrucomicrobiota bacterium]
MMRPTLEPDAPISTEMPELNEEVNPGPKPSARRVGPIFRLSLASLVIGVIVAYGAWGFRAVFGTGGNWLRNTGWLVEGWIEVALLGGSGLVFGLLLLVTGKTLGMRRFYTPAHVIVASAERGAKLNLRASFLTIFADAVALSLQAPVGRYGPTVMLGAAISSGFSRLVPSDDASRRVMLGCGVAAAISASFNAPIAGVIFAHEVMLGHFKLRAFAPITLASVSAVAITRFHEVEYVTLKLFAIPRELQLWDYPLFVLLGIISAALATGYMIGIVKLPSWSHKLKIPRCLQPTLGGIIAGLILWLTPLAAGLGDDVIQVILEQDLERPSYSLTLLLVLAASKFLASIACLGLRYPGGAFMPAMFFGAAVGGAFGMLFPSLDYQIAVLVGMGATVSAVVGAPLAVILIVFELTENYLAATAVMVGVVASNALVTRFYSRSLFHRTIRGWGVDLESPAEQRWLQSRPIGSLLKDGFDPVRSDQLVSEVLATSDTHHHEETFVADDEGQLIGKVPPMRLSTALSSEPVGSLAIPCETVFTNTDSVWEVFEKVRGVEGLVFPVIGDRKELVGVIRREELVEAYREAVEQTR